MRERTPARRAALATLLVPLFLFPSCGRSDAPASNSSTVARNDTAKVDNRSATPASEASHWDYSAERGPADWGSLDSAYAACGDGASQSPIDFSTTSTSEHPEVKMNYSPQELRIVHHEHKADVVNTGHSIQVTYTGADTLVLGDRIYTLVQYHFHSPSEHTVNGAHYPMEMHMVHKSADNRLAVVGVFIEEGAHNGAFDPIWSNLPNEKGNERHLEHVTVDVDELLPVDRSTYRYEGSLTTPPCSEGVAWMVFTTPVHLSARQIEAFRDVLKGNNRPTQPLNGRTVGHVAMKETDAR